MHGPNTHQISSVVLTEENILIVNDEELIVVPQISDAVYELSYKPMSL